MKNADEFTYVIAEGQADAEFLTALLAHTPELQVKVMAAQGWSSALSLARTLLLSTDRRLVLALDADAVGLEGTKQVVATGLGQVASQDRWRVHVFAPDIETELLRGATGPELHSADSPSKRRQLLSRKLESAEFVRTLVAQPELRTTLDFMSAPQLKAAS